MDNGSKNNVFQHLVFRLTSLLLLLYAAKNAMTLITYRDAPAGYSKQLSSNWRHGFLEQVIGYDV